VRSIVPIVPIRWGPDPCEENRSMGALRFQTAHIGLVARRSSTADHGRGHRPARRHVLPNLRHRLAPHSKTMARTRFHRRKLVSHRAQTSTSQAWSRRTRAAVSPPCDSQSQWPASCGAFTGEIC
jgi:hypothetical protein